MIEMLIGVIVEHAVAVVCVVALALLLFLFVSAGVADLCVDGPGSAVLVNLFSTFGGRNYFSGYGWLHWRCRWHWCGCCTC
jgi:hypothetical protein